MTGDELVLSMVQAGDSRQAATVLLRTHGPSVLRYLRSLLQNEGAVDDAFSLFAEWAWSGICRFRGESSLRTWALGVAWNAARRVSDEAWRKNKERLKTQDASKLAQEIRASSAMELDRQANSLNELRRQLSPDEQNLLALRIDQQLAWEEIATILASTGEEPTVATLRKRFERLKQHIARMARERGLVKQ
jgi:RNA polymerase sigma-70 factor (ECF subfamily)